MEFRLLGFSAQRLPGSVGLCLGFAVWGLRLRGLRGDSFEGSNQESWNIIILMPLRYSIRDPSTNPPKSMFQLSGVYTIEPLL